MCHDFYRSFSRLCYFDDMFGNFVIIRYPNTETRRQAIQRDDMVVVAVLIFGESAPKLLQRSMLAGVKQGTATVDVAIDQG